MNKKQTLSNCVKLEHNIGTFVSEFNDILDNDRIALPLKKWIIKGGVRNDYVYVICMQEVCSKLDSLYNTSCFNYDVLDLFIERNGYNMLDYLCDGYLVRLRRLKINKIKLKIVQ